MLVWNLKHSSMITYVPKLRNSIFYEFANLSQIVCRQRQDSGFFIQSIAYEWRRTPCICMQWMWDPFYVGVEPQLPHHDNICTPAASYNYSGFCKSGPSSMVVNTWKLIHQQSIHSIWMLSNTLHMYAVGMGIISCWSGASIPPPW